LSYFDDVSNGDKLLDCVDIETVDELCVDEEDVSNNSKSLGLIQKTRPE